MASAYSVLVVFIVSHFSFIGASLLQPKHPCVPVSAARGPCHDCICSVGGVFHCRAVHCKELVGPKGISECEPYKLYRNEHTICECSEHGSWNSKNCQSTFRYLQPKGGFGDMKLKSKVPCVPGNLYLVGCNVCKCPSFGIIEAAGCSNRRCFKGSKTKRCKYGDLLKTHDELCSCSDANVYIDRLCIKVSNKSVQRITPNDIVPIIDYGEPWAKEYCVSNEKYWLDCNSCTCEDNGDLQCTNNICSRPEKANASVSRRIFKNKLPELDDEDAGCSPGHSYRIKCNTCVCSAKGKLHCTTMICWISKNHEALPEINEGEPCVKGQVYKKDCNTCHCFNIHSLVCTKMACVSSAVMNTMKLNTTLQEFPKKCIPGKFYKKGCKKCFCQENGKAFCSKTSNCKDTKMPTSPAALRSYSSDEFHLLPSLPHEAAACEAGATYRVDCNTCLCLANGNLMCEKLLCPSFDDVNRLNAKNMSGGACAKGDPTSVSCIQCKCRANVLQCQHEPGCVPPETRKLLHGDFPGNGTRVYLDPQKDKCLEGMVYRTNCNKCYCQKDQSARCTQRTCLNLSQVRRMKKLRLKLEKNAL